MSKKDSPNYKEGLKQTAKNVAAAGAGAAIGYYGGGRIAKKLTETRRFREYYKSLKPAQRKALADRIRLAGSVAGSAAGALSTNALQRALESEKTAEFFINYAYNNLV